MTGMEGNTGPAGDIGELGPKVRRKTSFCGFRK